MNMLSFSVFLAFVGASTALGFNYNFDFREKCLEEHSDGLSLLEDVYAQLSEDARRERERRIDVLADNFYPELKDRDSEGVAKAFRERFAKEPIQPIFHVNKASDDPFVLYGRGLRKFLSDDSGCQPGFTDLNSVTEAQLFGFLSVLATQAPGPFCSICHRITEEALNRAIRPGIIMGDPSTQKERLLFDAQIPTAKTICSALAPGCYPEYDSIFANFTDAVVCAECAGCMTLMTLIEHRVLLDDTMLNTIYNVGTALVCQLLQNYLPVPQDTCVQILQTALQILIPGLQELFKPERFCSVELKVCEMNETPNALHCLKEFCVEGLENISIAAGVCSLIPDDSADADAFLNIMNKPVKEKRDIHFKYEEKVAAMAASRDEF